MTERTLLFFLVRCRTCNNQVRICAYSKAEAEASLSYMSQCYSGNHVAFPVLRDHVDLKTLREVPYETYLTLGATYEKKPNMLRALLNLIRGCCSTKEFIRKELAYRTYEKAESSESHN
jgi:hypothetical protein